MTSTGPRRGRRSTCLHPLRDWPAMYACRLRASLSAPAGGLPAPLPSVPASFSGNHDRARRRLPCKFLRTRGGLSVCFPGTAAVLSVIGLWAWALSMWRSGGRWVLVTAAISLAYPSHVGCHRLRVVFRAAMGAVFFGQRPTRCQLASWPQPAAFPTLSRLRVTPRSSPRPSRFAMRYDDVVRADFVLQARVPAMWVPVVWPGWIEDTHAAQARPVGGPH